MNGRVELVCPICGKVKSFDETAWGEILLKCKNIDEHSEVGTEQVSISEVLEALAVENNRLRVWLEKVVRYLRLSDRFVPTE